MHNARGGPREGARWGRGVAFPIGGYDEMKFDEIPGRPNDLSVGELAAVAHRAEPAVVGVPALYHLALITKAEEGEATPRFRLSERCAENARNGSLGRSFREACVL